MSYNNNFAIDSVLNNLEKNCNSVSMFIQPSWLQAYYQTVTEANFALARTVVAETEKMAFIKK